MNRREYHKEHRQRKRKGERFITCIVLLLVIVLELLFFLNFPHLEVIGDETLELTTHDKFNDPGVKLKNSGKELDPENYETSGAVDLTKAGEYTVNYQVSYFGLKSQVSRKVKVVQPESVSPVKMTLNGPEQLNLYIGRKYEELGAQVEGGDDADIQDKLEIEGTVDTNTPGKYEITYKVTDALGAVHQLTRVVNVVEQRIYLTFDDGPNETITPQFLKILKDAHVKGTFFVTGYGPDELIKQAYDDGHTIGLHTFDHEYSNVYASVDNYFNDLNKVAQRVKKITGEDSKIIRFPGGGSNSISAKYSPGIMSSLVVKVQEKGYQYFDWNVSSGDGGNQNSSEQPLKGVTTNLIEGADNIVLMHDTKQTSADALQGIIDYGIEHGYAFEKLEFDSFPAHHGVTN
ncbi:immunoglobulin-like domain-containing protein [Enterococcus sp. AZ109]|uniref:immunoglobulin-like domain-containing protein n=1 Tax=Enterococcus sp. AZ109 TaxID=2774634 RepID=UPI003F2035D0